MTGVQTCALPILGYLTSQISHADVVVDGDFASQGIMLRGASSGVYSILADNSANWNTAFGWGNHASAGYAASGHNHSGVYEPVLGNPANNGYVLSSTTTGTRSWVAMSGGVAWGSITGTLSSQTDLNTALGNKQGISANLTSLAGLTYASASFVKMTAAGTFSLDTNAYSVSGHTHTTANITDWATATSSFLTSVPNNSVSYAKLSVYNGASQGNCLTYDSTYGLTWSAMAAASHTHTTANLTDWATATSGFSLTSHNHSGVYAPVFTLTTTGTSGAATYTANVLNIPQYAGTAYTLPLAANGTRGGVQLGYANYYGTIGITLSGEQLVCVMAKSQIEYALTGNISSHTHSYEPTLGNPGTNGYVLSSTTAGVRSWVAAAGGYTLPATGVGSLGGIKLGFSATGSAVPLQTSSDMGFVTISKASVEYVLTGAISTHTHSYAPINGSSSNAFSTANLSVTGTISASSTITGSEVYRGSSRALKKNIADFDFDALGFLNDVSIKRYYLKSNNSFGIGFIAEDTHPWLSGDDQKSHVFGNHLGILTKAIQEEDQKVEALKLEVWELHARVRELEIARANGWS